MLPKSSLEAEVFSYALASNAGTAADGGAGDQPQGNAPSDVAFVARYHTRTIQESKVTFTISIVFSIIGFVVILTSILWIFLDRDKDALAATELLRETRLQIMDKLDTVDQSAEAARAQIAATQQREQETLTQMQAADISIKSISARLRESLAFSVPTGGDGTDTLDPDEIEHQIITARGEIPPDASLNYEQINTLTRDLNEFQSLSQRHPEQLAPLTTRFQELDTQVRAGMEDTSTLNLKMADDARSLLVSAYRELLILMAADPNLSRQYESQLESIEQERGQLLGSLTAADNKIAEENRRLTESRSAFNRYSEAFVGLVTGTIIQSIGALFFVQTNRARRQLSEFFDRLRADRRFDEAMSLIRSVTDPAKQAELHHAAAMELIKSPQPDTNK